MAAPPPDPHRRTSWPDDPPAATAGTAGLEELKDHLLAWLTDQGHEAVDHGPFVYDALDDYPVFCLRAAEGVAAERADGLDSLGVVIGGSGNGEQMAANKVKGIR